MQDEPIRLLKNASHCTWTS